MSDTILEIKNLSYKYYDGDHIREIFSNTSATFEKGKFYSITGESGAGKTTLLYCLGGLDTKYDGEILFEGDEIQNIGLERYRRNCVSMVYQNYNLIPYLTPIQNIYIASNITDNRKMISEKECLTILNALGIDERKAKSKSSLLSGGEQQRVAIARALSVNSPLIIADEPTGNLDHETGIQVIPIFQELSKAGKTIIMVTHNKVLADMCDMHYWIDQKYGKLVCV